MGKANLSESDNSAADLTAAVLDEEASRLEAERADRAVEVRADEELPGVGKTDMSLREGIAIGGTSTIAMLAALNGLDELEREAATLLAPDIQDTLGVSDLVIAVITVGGMALLSVVDVSVAGGLRFRGINTTLGPWHSPPPIPSRQSCTSCRISVADDL
jgi:hypothetical protein